MPVKSLVDLASAACIKHIRNLDSVGDYLPYENVRHILFKVEQAPQLRRIELNSPQLEGKTGEIWLKLIERDFPIEYRNKAYKPQNPSKWYKVWEKYKRDHDASVEESALKLRSAFAGLRQDKEKNTSMIVGRKLLPRKGRLTPKRGPGQVESRSNLAFASGSRTKTLSGAGVMRKVRREVKEMATIHGSLSRTAPMPARYSHIQRAPPSMIEAHRIAAQPKVRKPPPVPSAVVEHEAKATFITDSEDSQDDDDELWDDELEEAAPRSSAKLSSKPAASVPTKSPLKPKPLAPPKPRAGVLPAATGRMAQKFGGNSSLARKIAPSASNTIKTVLKSTTNSTPNNTDRPSTSISTKPLLKPTSRTSEAEPEPQEIEKLPPAKSSSPPLPGDVASERPPGAPSRKRKAVGIFMRPKKRA